MPRFAVIDTETTWRDRVMSLGAVIADSATLQPVETKYYILDPEFREGGMYSSALILRREDKNAFSAREEAMDDLLSCLRAHGAKQVFAYNARFDRAHLPELASFGWYDIMALAAYRTYNPHIPEMRPCIPRGGCGAATAWSPSFGCFPETAPTARRTTHCRTPLTNSLSWNCSATLPPPTARCERGLRPSAQRIRPKFSIRRSYESASWIICSRSQT